MVKKEKNNKEKRRHQDSKNGSEPKEETLDLDKEAEINKVSPETKIAELTDKLLRAQAEIQNVRRVSAQEVMKARLYGVDSIAREFLSVGDNLERVLKACQNDSTLDSLLKGLELTIKSFEASLKTAGIEPVDPEGKIFDSDKHEAISIIEDDQNEDNTVIEVIQRGYTIQERILRPAKVIVSKKSKKK